MAHHNIGHFYGMVQTKPTITIDDETGAIKSAIMYMITASSSRKFENANEDTNIRFDQIMVKSGVHETAEIMAQINPFDIVIIKGSINTRNVNKMASCPNCGRRFQVNESRNADSESAPAYTTSMVTFITPIDIDIRNTDLDEETAMDILVSHREMSNEIQLVGNLCADPQQWEGGKATAYQLGISRKFYLKDDDPSISADYPYIRSYGVQADADFETLKKGSLVLVDGFVKMRHFNRRSVCPYCGETKTWIDKVLEVVPFSVEYLQEYKSSKQREASMEGISYYDS